MFARISRIAPQRGWRAFFGEVGIIVLGVLIAVGIGQVVEALDWRGRVANARQILDNNVREFASFAFNERIATTPCLLRQLDRLQQTILAASPGAPARVRVENDRRGPVVYHYPDRLWDTRQWDSVLSDNIPAHMPTAERETYANLYAGVDMMARLNVAERDDVNNLELLGLGLPLDDRLRTDLLGVIVRERQRVLLMELIARQQLAALTRADRGYPVSADDRAGMKTLSWCRASGLA